MASFFSIRLLPFEQPIDRVVQLRLLDVVQLQFVGQTVLGRFALHAGEVGELGSGGCERGIRRGPLQTADQVIDEMLPYLLDDLP